MKSQIAALFAALLAIGLLLFQSPERALSEEQSKPASDAAAKSRLRTGKDAIQAALAEKTDLDVKEIPLAEVVRRIRMKHHVQLQFDTAALKDAAIDPNDLPVSLQIKGVTVRSALKLILSQFNLTFVLQDESLQITTKDKANTMLSTHVYDVRDVLPNGDRDDSKFDSLIALITGTVATQSWNDVGGPGSISGLQPASLVVSQIEEVQEEIEFLLKAIRLAVEQTKAGKFENLGISDQSDAEKAIVKSLRQPVDLDFQEKPRNAVAAEIEKRHQLQIVFDVNSLKDAAIDAAELPVTYSGKGVTLKSALNAILSPVNLTWLIQDEVLVITTRDKANTILTTRLYPVEDLIERQNETAEASQAPMTPDANSVIDVVTSTVAAQTWSSVGGPGTIQGYDKDGLILVVSQTREVHDEIADLLAQLREVRHKQKEETAKSDEKPADPSAMVLRVYDLRVSAPATPAMTPQEVMEIIKGLIEPKSWGQGDAFIRGATGKLVVRHTPAVHVAVVKLLDEIGASPPKIRMSGLFTGRGGRAVNGGTGNGAAMPGGAGGGGF